MHLIFSMAAKKPEIVDRIVNSKLRLLNPLLQPTHNNQPTPNFSYVYHKLFPPNGEFSTYMKSFLSIFSQFDFNQNDEMQKNDEELLPTKEDWDITQDIFAQLEIPNSADYWNVYKFWTCLVKLYREIKDSPDTKKGRFHNIFEFMDRFHVANTRVVIIGHDPSPDWNSSGYAFHGSPCPSTRNTIDHLNKELKLVGDFLDDQDSIEIPEPNLQEYKNTCQLNGWIQQGVLLFNSCFTRGHSLWKYVSGCIIKYLNDTRPHLVFILAGDKDKQEWIIDKPDKTSSPKKHLVLSLNHPGGLRSVRFNGNFWDQNLPYLSTNFFFYQLSLNEANYEMINWTNITGQEGSRLFIEKSERLFSQIYNHVVNIKGKVLSLTGDYVMPNPERSDAYKRSLLVEKYHGFFSFTYFDYFENENSFDNHKFHKLRNATEADQKEALEFKNNMNRNMFHEMFSRGYMHRKMFDACINLTGDLNYVDKKGHTILQTLQLLTITDKEHYIKLIKDKLIEDKKDKLKSLEARAQNSDEVEALKDVRTSEETQPESDTTESIQTEGIDSSHQSPNKKPKTEI